MHHAGQPRIISLLFLLLPCLCFILLRCVIILHQVFREAVGGGGDLMEGSLVTCARLGRTAVNAGGNVAPLTRWTQPSNMKDQIVLVEHVAQLHVHVEKHTESKVWGHIELHDRLHSS